MNKVGIIGYGEVGSSLHKLLEQDRFEVCIHDPAQGLEFTCEELEFIHLCVPGLVLMDKASRAQIVELINKQTRLKMVINHSSVAPGTTRALSLALKSPIVMVPIRGVHPILDKGMEHFWAMIGSQSVDDLMVTAEHFNQMGFGSAKCGCTWEEAELAKLLSTTRLGYEALWTKWVGQLCEDLGVSFDMVHRVWTESYNMGFDKLGKHHLKRSVLEDIKGPLGGHCVIPNAKLLSKFLFIKELNGGLVDRIIDDNHDLC